MINVKHCFACPHVHQYSFYFIKFWTLRNVSLVRQRATCRFGHFITLPYPNRGRVVTSVNKTTHTDTLLDYARSTERSNGTLSTHTHTLTHPLRFLRPVEYKAAHAREQIERNARTTGNHRKRTEICTVTYTGTESIKIALQRKR